MLIRIIILLIVLLTNTPAYAYMECITSTDCYFMYVPRKISDGYSRDTTLTIASPSDDIDIFWFYEDDTTTTEVTEVNQTDTCPPGASQACLTHLGNGVYKVGIDAALNNEAGKRLCVDVRDIQASRTVAEEVLCNYVYTQDRVIDTDNMGMNWADIINPTTTQNLSGTSVLISDGTGAGQIDTLSGSIVNVGLADTCTAVTNGVTLATSQSSVTFSGNVAITDGLTITRSTANQPAISATGNGTGAGVYAAGGINGDGLYTIGGVAGGAGFQTKGQGTGNVSSGMIAWGDGGPGVLAKSTSGIDGIQAATLTGDITGNLSGSVASVTGAVNSVTTDVNINMGQTLPATPTNDTTGRALKDADANVSQTGDSFARLGAPAGASVSADVAAIQSDTNDIQGRLPTALVGGKMDSFGSLLKQITVSVGTTASTIVSTGSFTETSNKGYVGGIVNCPNATATENRPVFLKIISFDPATDKVTLNGSFPTVLTTGDVCNIYIDTVR